MVLFQLYNNFSILSSMPTSGRRVGAEYSREYLMEGLN